MYPLLRFFLFLLPPETAHFVALEGLKWLGRLHLLKKPPQDVTDAFSYKGLRFKSRIGLAAGLDKNGDYIDALGALGFGFIEIGTLTPKAQKGNAKPRLFRIKEKQALVNAMGFNNKGIDYGIKQLKKARYTGIIGVNIGKNKDTPLKDAVKDYQYCLEQAYGYADYITVNISSPNTKGLRDLQQDQHLSQLLKMLKRQQKSLRAKYGCYKNIFIKIAPDLSDTEIASIAEQFNHHNIDGVIISNTSSQWPDDIKNTLPIDHGGISGKVLLERSNAVLTKMKAHLNKEMLVIAVGGVDSKATMAQKQSQGADLVQCYTGLIYQGPGLIKKLRQQR